MVRVVVQRFAQKDASGFFVGQGVKLIRLEQPLFFQLQQLRPGCRDVRFGDEFVDDGKGDEDKDDTAQKVDALEDARLDAGLLGRHQDRCQEQQGAGAPLGSAVRQKKPKPAEWLIRSKTGKGEGSGSGNARRQDKGNGGVRIDRAMRDFLPFVLHCRFRSMIKSLGLK